MSQSTSRRIGIAVVGNAVGPLVALITAPILAQNLGVDARGEVGAATAPLLLGISVLALGLPEAATYAVARRSASIRVILRWATPSLIAATIVGIGALVWLRPSLAPDHPDVQSLILLCTVALFPALLLALLRGIASGVQAWSLITTERLVAAISRLLLVVGFALAGNLTMATATLSIAAPSALALVVYLRLPRYTQHHLVPVITETAASFHSYGGRMWFGALSGILLSRIDQALLLPLHSAFALGIYVVAVSISELPLVFNSAVRDVMFATEAEKQDPVRVAQASRISTLVVASIALATGVLTIWLMTPLFGAEFAPAITVTWVLLAAVVVGNPGSVAGAALSARGRPGLRSWSLFMAMVLNVVAVVLLVPHLGAMGAAIATLLGNAAAGWLNIVWLKRFFGIPISSFVGMRRDDLHTIRSIARSRMRR